jgi:hypothetical protein
VICRLFALLVSLINVPALAAESPESQRTERDPPVDQNRFSRPDPRGTPTRIRLGIYVVNVTSIDNVHQTYSCNFILNMQWRDNRLAPAGGEGAPTIARYRLEEVWYPKHGIANQHSLQEQLDRAVEVDPEGTVTYVQRYHGDLTAALDLRDFPLDQQVLPISVVLGPYGPDDIEIVVNDERTGRAQVITVADFDIGAPSVRVGLYDYSETRKLPRLDYALPAIRHTGYYVFKVVIPLALIVAMSWLVFWLDPKQFAPQVSIAMLSMLSLIAYQFALAGLLPRISYLTRVDTFLLGSTVLVFLALLQAVITGILAGRDQEAAVRTIDRFARIAFPVAFLLLLGLAFFV